MSILKKLTSLVFLTIFCFAATYAQTPTSEDVSEKDLQLFAKAIKLMQVVEEQAQQKMITAVEEVGLDVQSYNNLQQKIQNSDQAENVSEEEMQQFNSASTAIQEIQLETQSELEEKIVEAGLTVEKYQTIGATVQSDPELQNKLQEYLQ
ncbi:MAG: DUF4168 domain-containing protein [Bacteroidota bacterium]